MYQAKPLGINIKANDYDVPDGFLRESINLQWRDGAFRPVPERLISTINVSGYSNIILHKVSDENQINVLGFKSAAPNINVLFWFGKIVDGVYEAVTPVNLTMTKTAGISFTILNGLVYFMGDGSSAAEQYYYRFQYIESSGSYEVKDMYEWKTLIPFYPFQADIEMVSPKSTVNVFSQCGLILIRYAVVLKSGEIVLHSPIYAFGLYGLNRSTAAITKGTVIENIHALVNMDLSYADTVLFEQEISAINFYATTPFYESALTVEYSGANDIASLVTSETVIGQITIKSQEPFYLIKTIPSPNNEKILLTSGQLDSDITFTSVTTSKIDISTIAAGEIMPVDNFSYHKLYGQVTSNNGRIIINKPTTVLSPGHIRSLATEATSSYAGFRIDTEDGKIDGLVYAIDKSLGFIASVLYSRGILSYPDSRVTETGGGDTSAGAISTSAINAAGTDYLINDILTISAGNSDATIRATAIIGEIISAAINNSGTGYAVSDTITVSGGGGDAMLTVSSIGGGGEVLAFILSSGGTDYVTASAVATTTSGVGADFALDITAVKGAIVSYNVVTTGSGYTTATAVATTVVPAGGTGFTIDITAVGQVIVRTVKTRKNELHNIACAFDMSGAGFDNITFVVDGTDVKSSSNYNVYFNYANYEEIASLSIVSAKYSSENRVQFSEAGEFSVWPAINSYRIGEGKIMGVGSNSINPADTLTVAPLIVGTTDGVYTINLDPSGNNLIASITKNASIPYISKETLQIGDQLLFISDRGLMAFNGGEPISLTEPYFPDHGNGDFPTNETIYPNYNAITTRYFGGTGNPYTVDDIVDYLKDAFLAYDSRRETIWCSNPNKTYSLTYGVKTRLWGMNTLVFNDRIELFSTITTAEGDIYSRYLVRKSGEDNLLILSGEDSTKEVVFHLLTRPLKMQNPDGYKRIGKIMSRCEYFRKNTSTGYFTFGLWGKQDANKNKVNIPLMAISDISATNFPSDVRQDIPIGSQKGKYKFITILQGGKALPESSISRYDIEAYLVDEKQLR